MDSSWIDYFRHGGQLLSTVLIPLVLAITVHEAAHAWMADKLGDDTARKLGRVTLNPIPHIDLVGTVVLPALLLAASSPFLIGFAKPVPVQFSRLRDPRRGMIWVALAGPGINIAMAIAALLVGHLLPATESRLVDWIASNLYVFVDINIVLAVFNMIPLPPLDGGRVLTGLMPYRIYWKMARFERQGIAILLALVILVPLISGQLGYPINPLVWLLEPAAEAVRTVLLRLTGW